MRQDDTLPEGYCSRDRGKLALCIKVHRSATAEECADAGADLGRDSAETVAIANKQGTKGYLGPWGLEWLKAFAELEPEEFSTLQGFAFDDAHEQAEEEARRLFGKGVRLYTDGRSGGWLTLHGTYTPDDARAALEAVSYADTGTMPENGDAPTPEEIDDARELLRKLEEFRAYVASYVADFPRAVAWQVCNNAFAPMLAEQSKARALTSAEERLELATLALRHEAGRALWSGIDTGAPPARWETAHAVREARHFGGVLDEYDTARAEVTRLRDAQ